MFRKKVYGDSTSKCFRCGESASFYNRQKVSVCKEHQHTLLEVDKCPVCKGFVEIKQGKYGAFIACDNCKPMSIKKYLSFI
ncbi:MAG: hypothetical protein ABH828_00940 [archaeon]